MLYYLFTYLKEHYDLPGAGVFQYISFRASLSVITSLIISLFIGKRIINFLRRKQVGETIRDLGLDGQKIKQGTPTMGGLIILASILIPVFLFAKLDNVYIILIIISTVWLGLMGFIDDYIKVFKKDKKGLKGIFKIIGQVGIGLIVGIAMYFNKYVVIKEKTYDQQIITRGEVIKINTNLNSKTNIDLIAKRETRSTERAARSTDIRLFAANPVKSTKTTIPFIKNNEFDYSYLLSWIGDGYKKWTFLVFIPIVVLIVAAVFERR